MKAYDDARQCSTGLVVFSLMEGRAHDNDPSLSHVEAATQEPAFDYAIASAQLLDEESVFAKRGNVLGAPKARIIIKT